MTKPFSPREVVARVQAILRRARGNLHTAFHVGRLVVDAAARRVRWGGVEVELTAVEFGLLATLAQHPEMVWTRAQLVDTIWGGGPVADERVVDVHVGRVRRKLEHHGAGGTVIATVRGVGYRLEAQG